MSKHPESHEGEGHKVQSLEALDRNIDRKKLSLAEQTRRAEKLVKSEGITRSAAMAKVARIHLRSQRAKPEPRATGEKGKKGSLTPSGPPNRDPFGTQRRPDPSKITRRGGKQPKK